MASGGTLTEVEVDEKITGLRAQQPGFKQPSFDTIAGEGRLATGQEGYSPADVESAARLSPRGQVSGKGC